MTHLRWIGVVGLLALAVPAFAAPTFAELVNVHFTRFIDTYIIPLLYALAFLFFIIGVVRYFFTGGEESRQTARSFIIWSLVGMVVLFGVWGIVRVMLSLIQVS